MSQRFQPTWDVSLAGAVALCVLGGIWFVLAAVSGSAELPAGTEQFGAQLELRAVVVALSAIVLTLSIARAGVARWRGSGWTLVPAVAISSCAVITLRAIEAAEDICDDQDRLGFQFGCEVAGLFHPVFWGRWAALIGGLAIVAVGIVRGADTRSR